MSKEPELSVVIPMYREEPNVEPLVRELLPVFGDLEVEILLIDDGSDDRTFEEIARVHEEIDSRVRGIRLRRHGGKTAAYKAGFRAALAPLVATMDGDLQDDPADVLKLRGHLDDQGFDMVIGWKTTGKSSPTTFLLSKLFNGMIRLMSALRVHDMNCPLRVMKAGVARELAADLRADHHRYLPLLAHARGYAIAELPVANRDRLHGSSKYGPSKYLASATAWLGMALYIRFGDRPMQLFGTLGLASFLFGFVICGWVAFAHFAFGSDIDDDLPTLILGGLMILIGTQFLSMGLLSEIVLRRMGASSGDDAEVGDQVGGPTPQASTGN